MNEFKQSALTVERTLSKKLPGEEVPALIVTVTYPEFTDLEEGAKRRLNRFYQRAAFEYLSHCEAWLLPEARLYLNEAAESGRRYRPWEASMACVVTYNDSGVVSIRRDIRETIPNQGIMHLRFGDNWDLNTGFPLYASTFFPKRAGGKKLLRRASVKAAAELSSAGLGSLHPRAKKLIRRRLDPQNFCLTDGGLEVIFQEDVISSGPEGVTAFVIPWDEAGPVCPAAENGAQTHKG